MSSPPIEPSDAANSIRFRDLALAPAVQAAIEGIGYEMPSPIQAKTIPPLLEGRDVLGQAQTGTGKTAAFALPILSKLDLSKRAPQALVLAPTRELAIQVAEAFQKYAVGLNGFHVLPIYGGQSYEPQLKGLKRGAHVIVGTPGRVVDHLKRGSLVLDQLAHMVLDEADEMLRMGFIDDVEWVLQQTPPTRQVALFSATMPSVIRRVANTYLRDPVEITIKSKTTTGANIRQRYWLVSGLHKLDALTRFLEVEPFDGMIVFARTKAATMELTEKLEARGFSVAALNGDLEQKQRERTIQRLKDGQVDIIVATDVAARGLDVERISHVVNYDIPTDTESYVHRIGRTGRAGRSGEAILFVSPRERHLLKAIERATRQPIESMAAPSVDAINAKRIEKFTQTIADSLAKAQSDQGAGKRLDTGRAIIARFEEESGASLLDIAAALAGLLQGERPLLMGPDPGSTRESFAAGPKSEPRFESPSRAERPHEKHSEKRPEKAAFVPSKDRDREPPPAAAPMPTIVARPKPPAAPKLPFAGTPDAPPAFEREEAPRTPRLVPQDLSPPVRERPRKDKKNPDVDFETFRIEVGSTHGVKAGNIVGAIANEAGLDSQFIGKVEILEEHSFVDLPSGMPKQIFKDLRKVWVSGRQLAISRADDPVAKDEAAPKKFGPGSLGKPKKPRF